MKKGTVKKIMKGIAITALAFALLTSTGVKKPDIHGNGDNHIRYTQK